jgi:hypothetical protein
VDKTTSVLFAIHVRLRWRRIIPIHRSGVDRGPCLRWINSRRVTPVITIQGLRSAIEIVRSVVISRHDEFGSVHVKEFDDSVKTGEFCAFYGRRIFCEIP